MAHLIDIATTLLTAVLTALPALVAPWSVLPQEPDTMRQTLQFPASANGDRVLEVSNLAGHVRIVAEDRQDVSVVAVRSAGRTGASITDGPRPDFRQLSDRVLVCGDAERCGCHANDDRRRPGRRDWSDVRVDLEVRVPKKVALDVCAVSGGVNVEGVDGRYELRTVSGGVTMTEVRGSGRVRTVNGGIEAVFAEPPAGPSDFKTVNGRIDVHLPGNVSADLRLRTLRGDLLTDFDTTRLPSRLTQEERGGRRIYRADRYTARRIGQGGTELTFETVNGDVRIRRRAERQP